MSSSVHPPKEIYLNTYNAEKVRESLDLYGVAVVQNYFSDEIADGWLKAIKTWLFSISKDLTEDEKTWVKENLPYGPRLGMMQGLVSHCPTVWQIRELMYPLYRELWNTEHLYTSIDGATVHPYIPDDGKDWPHIDQTCVDVDCIQGQVVLTNTTASFRCTPCSHLYHKEILELFNRTGDPSNWLKFTDAMIKQMKETINSDLFKFWQVPIHVPKGSVIFWKSNTIHSAKKNDIGDHTWRGVVYVSMRPSDQYTKADKKTLAKAATEGLTTNHWGTSIFPKRPGMGYVHPRSSSIEKLTDNPTLVALRTRDWTPLLLKITAQPKCRLPYTTAN